MLYGYEYGYRIKYKYGYGYRTIYEYSYRIIYDMEYDSTVIFNRYEYRAIRYGYNTMHIGYIGVTWDKTQEIRISSHPSILQRGQYKIICIIYAALA